MHPQPPVGSGLRAVAQSPQPRALSDGDLGTRADMADPIRVLLVDDEPDFLES